MEARHSIVTTALGWRADGVGGGTLVFSDRHQRFLAIPTVNLRLSGLTKGERGRIGSAKDSAGHVAPETYILFALMLSGLGCESTARRYREACADRLEIEPEIAERFVNSPAEFERFAGDWLATLVKETGANGLSAVASLLRKIEEKVREPTAEEVDLLRVVESESAKSGGVPTKKAVRRGWLEGRCGRTEDQFDATLDAIGFQWLPTAKRGKDAH